MTKYDVYNDKVNEGIVPQHVSKRLKSKRPSKSKTPRSIQKKQHLKLANNSNKNSDVKRANTSAEIHPSSNVPYNMFDKTPTNAEKAETRFVNKNFKSYDNSKNLKHNNKEHKLSIEGHTKYKINPSPYKRREKSIDELIQYLQKQVEEIEQLEIIERKPKNKHTYGIRPATKLAKRKSKTKARSHSPNENRKPAKTVTIGLPKKQNMKKIPKEQLITLQPKSKKKVNKSQISRNK